MTPQPPVVAAPEVAPEVAPTPAFPDAAQLYDNSIAASTSAVVAPENANASLVENEAEKTLVAPGTPAPAGDAMLMQGPELGPPTPMGFQPQTPMTLPPQTPMSMMPQVCLFSGVRQGTSLILDCIRYRIVH